jgi:hypothetical protein
MMDREFIIEQFHKVKELGYVKSNRSSNTGIGKTFEDYVGVVENNLAEPDLAGYEVKSHRERSSSYITLFTKSPSFPKKANSILKEKFGTKYTEFPSLKKLHTSIFANKYNSCRGKYMFRLYNDRVDERIYIKVYSKNYELLDDSCYYTYEDISKVINTKLKGLFYVTAKTRLDKKTQRELFWFNKAEIFDNPTLERFLDLLDRGIIMYDIRIGCYHSGENFGKSHDHGSGFRIMAKHLIDLYDGNEVVE